jgi:hypothetical protein
MGNQLGYSYGISQDRKDLMRYQRCKKIIEDNSEYGNDTNIPCLLVQNKSDLIPADNPEEYQKK